MYQILRDFYSENKGPIFLEKHVRVSCISGGPGSEFVGLLKYLDKAGKVEPVEKISCYLLDAEQAWSDTWSEIDEGLAGNLKVNKSFQIVDASNPDSFAHQKKFLNADLFMISFFVSEIFTLDKNGGVSAFWKKVFDGAKSGALFVYVDNNSSSFNEYIDKISSAGGLETIFSDSTRFTPSSSEQASELKEYKEKFGRMSRLEGKISIRIFRKP